MPNTAKFLINDVHLLPLLQWYLQSVEPSLRSVHKLDDKHYEYIKGSEGCVAGIRSDVVCREKAGSYNIVEGYWRTLAQSLRQNDEVPQSIRVVSFINHNDIHWTSSVATFSVDQDRYRGLKQALEEKYTNEQIKKMTTNELQHFINAQFPEIDIFHSFEIKGAKAILVDHYDSHSPGNPKGRYFSRYFPTLKALTEANTNSGIDLSIQSKSCKQQLGNTCGDYTLFNGFSAGVLGLDVGDKSHQIDSVLLRSLSEHVIPVLSSTPSDEQHALKAEQKIKDLVGKSKTVAFKPAEIDVINSTQKEQPEVHPARKRRKK